MDEDPKSPRGNGAPAGGDAGAVTEEVMVFSLGDVKLALTHRKLLQDSHFFDLEFLLGGPKKSAPTRAHRAVIQVRCPALLQEGKFITKIDKKKPMWYVCLNLG